MICPKCQNVMKTVDKNGIHIDQCQGCRGIFLDRGELEAIAGAENSYYGGHQPPPYQGGGHAPAPHYGRPDSPRPHRGGYADSPKGYRGGYADSPKGYRGGYADSPHGYGHHGKRRKGGFLEGLFD
ncbi:zf-TFIIB domain-containing protein [Amycolatopsis thailandensis]|uniref:Transcriptional regulator n=3 Tax=Amycolatopsis TaxID=1813 RepID=A0A229RNZ4_9PSEU|nr:zf-TFIIB domain-containing protein [Amycolatopsis thailandensis]OXM48181.1 transcriptional regulator [Amycolatopsis thailandensis]